MSMTLQEALQTDAVQSFLGTKIQEAVSEALSGDALTGVLAGESFTALIESAVEAAIEKQLPTIRESVRDEVNKDGQVRSLHTEALRLIEASPLKGAAKANLLEDYGLVEAADDTVTPGRALALIEAEVDGEGKTVKTAKTVLRESIDADVKRVRNVLRESAPSFPVAPGGGSGDTPPAELDPGLLQESAAAERIRDIGMDPAQFGLAAPPEPAKA